MDIQEFDRLVMQARSVRRYKGDIPVTMETLRELIGLARVTPSSRNNQPLKYILVNGTEAREHLFSCIGWAAALTSWGGPAKSERPAAYIIILGDKSVSEKFSVDHGIVAQTMNLGARVRGLGGCMIASVDRPKLRSLLKIDDRYEILLVLVLGVPDEEITIEPMPSDGKVKYWRDENEVHHVPKRSLEELIVGEF